MRETDEVFNTSGSFRKLPEMIQKRTASVEKRAVKAVENGMKKLLTMVFPEPNILWVINTIMVGVMIEIIAKQQNGFPKQPSKITLQPNIFWEICMPMVSDYLKIIV